VNLAETTFVDSSGLGALVSGLKSARQAGGDLRLVAPSEQVSMVLRLTNLDRVLQPRASVEEALRD
jgi:anti-sigma B factor antagonist